MTVIDDTRRLRNALGWFATGVAIVTTRLADQNPVGLTINSFSSVSLEPPLVLWCLDKKSETVPAFNLASHFIVNVLSEGQQDLSNRFARKGRHEFDGIDVMAGVNGIPALRDALAHFQCAVDARHDAGDHIILIGRVVHFDYAEEGSPLLYHRGRYQAIA